MLVSSEAGRRAACQLRLLPGCMVLVRAECRHLAGKVRDMLAHASRHPGSALLMLPADVTIRPTLPILPILPALGSAPTEGGEITAEGAPTGRGAPPVGGVDARAVSGVAGDRLDLGILITVLLSRSSRGANPSSDAPLAQGGGNTSVPLTQGGGTFSAPLAHTALALLSSSAAALPPLSSRTLPGCVAWDGLDEERLLALALLAAPPTRQAVRGRAAGGEADGTALLAAAFASIATVLAAVQRTSNGGGVESRPPAPAPLRPSFSPRAGSEAWARVAEAWGGVAEEALGPAEEWGRAWGGVSRGEVTMRRAAVRVLGLLAGGCAARLAHGLPGEPSLSPTYLTNDVGLEGVRTAASDTPDAGGGDGVLTGVFRRCADTVRAIAARAPEIRER
ncbi:hypothetical protein T484DRAFT_1907698, partial [Baffinella frigidus]